MPRLRMCMMDDTAGHWSFVTCPGCTAFRIGPAFPLDVLYQAHTWKGRALRASIWSIQATILLARPSSHRDGCLCLQRQHRASAGDPILVDESLEQIVPESIQPGDIVGISVHTGNALRGYQVGRMARERGAWVVYGGIHATLFPEEALERGEGARGGEGRWRHCLGQGCGRLPGRQARTGLRRRTD